MIGERLRSLREGRGESLAAVGRAVGITGQAMGRYESEKDQPGGLILLKLAQHFGVSTAYLTGQADDPTRNSNLPPGWEEFARRAMADGFSPEEAELALRMLKAYKKAEQREG